MGKSPSIKVTTMSNSVAKNIVVVDIVLVGHVISQDYLIKELPDFFGWSPSW